MFRLPSLALTLALLALFAAPILSAGDTQSAEKAFEAAAKNNKPILVMTYTGHSYSGKMGGTRLQDFEALLKTSKELQSLMETFEFGAVNAFVSFKNTRTYEIEYNEEYTKKYGAPCGFSIFIPEAGRRLWSQQVVTQDGHQGAKLTEEKALSALKNGLQVYKGWAGARQMMLDRYSVEDESKLSTIDGFIALANVWKAGFSAPRSNQLTEKALKLVKKEDSKDSRIASMNFDMAETSMVCLDYSDGAERFAEFAKSFKKHENYSVALLHEAQCYFLSGDSKKAKKAYQKLAKNKSASEEIRASAKTALDQLKEMKAKK